MCWLKNSHLLGENESASHSVVSDSATTWTVACQAPLSIGFSRQEYWSGLPFRNWSTMHHVLQCFIKQHILKYATDKLAISG